MKLTLLQSTREDRQAVEGVTDLPGQPDFLSLIPGPQSGRTYTRTHTSRQTLK